ncbi:MAG: hypothetical protein SFV54_25175 [Bryobacteraceae bacterium]|nr:hypothetical protein [Bryobacteraceae bacterium]
MPPPEEVRDALRRILAGPHFAGARRLSAFLSLIVETTLDGRSGAIKEQLIATEVYERDASYDPRIDSIVRVEATRLRARLRAYYEGEGKDDTLRIELPKGRYVPVFVSAASPPAPPPPAQPAPKPAPSRRRWLTAAVPTLAAGAAVWLATSLRSPSKAPLALLMTAEKSPRGGWSPEADNVALAAANVLGRRHGLHAERCATIEEVRERARARGASHYLLFLAGQAWDDPQRTRVLAELRSAPANEPLWSQAFDHPHAHTSALVDAATSAAASAVARFTARPPSQSARALQLHREAQQILSRGKDFLVQTNEDIDAPFPLAEIMEAARLLERACAEDQSFSSAHAALAEVYRLAAEYDPRLAPKSLDAIQRALRINPLSAEANFARGYSAFFANWRFDVAEEAIRAAIDQSRLFVKAYRYYVDAAFLARRTQGVEHRLYTILSVLPNVTSLRFTAASLQTYTGNYAAAEAILRDTLARSPASAPVVCQLALALARQNKWDEAAALAGKAFALAPKLLRTAATRARLFALQGRRREALELSRQFDFEKRAPAIAGMLHSYLGDLTGAIRCYRLALEQHNHDLLYATLEPEFDAVRRHPAAAPILSALRLA